MRSSCAYVLRGDDHVRNWRHFDLAREPSLVVEVVLV